MIIFIILNIILIYFTVLLFYCNFGQINTAIKYLKTLVNGNI